MNITHPVIDRCAIDRILKAVEETKQGTKLAKRVDRDKLAKKLWDAEAHWMAYSAAHHASPKRVRKAQANQFRGIAKRATRLHDDITRTRRFRSVFDAPADFDAFVVSLKRIIDVAEGAAETYEYKAASGFRSPREWFVSNKLASIYEKCFGEPPGAGSREIHEAAPLMVHSPDLPSL